jgi:predicted DNA-binding mobile mystery protein A
MKTDKKQLGNQKRIIQQKIDLFAKLNEPMPPSGWLKAIRGSLGLTIRQLAERVGVGHGSIAQLEKREPKKKVTLESLENAARAMDCKIVYAIVPIESGNTLDDIIKSKAQEAAGLILKDVAHTMRLEKQGTSEKQIQKEIERVAKELIESNDPRIWEIKNKKLKVKTNVKI